MNFSQMHERLRMELLRRIRRGTLSVSLLSRQTGFGQAHLSNFLHDRRKLSLDAMDRILAAQHIPAGDLLPFQHHPAELAAKENESRVPLVSHSAALFEPFIRPSAVQDMLHVPGAWLQSARARAQQQRRTWQRFVAVSISADDASAMEPLLLPDAIVLIDRHYNSLMPYRPDRQNLYAVRHGSHLIVRYVDFVLNRLVLRPNNMTHTVDLKEIPPGESPGDLIAGRVAIVLNQF